MGSNTVQKTLTGEALPQSALLSTRNVYSHDSGWTPIHNWYTTVAGFSGEFILNTIDHYKIRHGGILIDSFSGTGTTPLAAMPRGIKVIGVEANPFHHLVAKVKVNFHIERNRAKVVRDAVKRRLSSSLASEGAYIFKTESTIPIEDHLSSIKEIGQGPPEMPHLSKWMSPRVLQRVLVVKRVVEELSEGLESDPIIDFVRVAFASILLPVSNVQLAGPKIAYRRHGGKRVICADAPVARLFIRKLTQMVSDLDAFNDGGAWVTPDIRLGDARRVSELLDCEADIAITSPPYLNDVDYIENTRLELFFLGLVKSETEMHDLKGRLIRANAKYLFKDNRDYPNNLPDIPTFSRVLSYCARIKKVWESRNWGWDHPRLVAEYFCDMTHHLEAMHGLLKRDARYIIVVGDSALDGILVPTDAILASIAQDVGYQAATVIPFRARASSRHRIRLRESIVTLTA